MTKLLSLLFVVLFGRKDQAVVRQEPEPVMMELAEVDRLEAKAAKHLMKKRRSR